jgi:hypothetical protein
MTQREHDMDRNLKSWIAQPFAAQADPRPFCGCGLSRIFPRCDSSQLISKSREPGKLVSCGLVKEVGRPRTEARTVEA